MTTPNYKQECTAKTCGCLASPQSIEKLFVINEEATLINLHVFSDCLGVIRKLEKDSKLVSMSTKLHPIIRGFLSLQLKRKYGTLCLPKHMHIKMI